MKRIDVGSGLNDATGAIGNRRPCDRVVDGNYDGERQRRRAKTERVEFGTSWVQPSSPSTTGSVNRIVTPLVSDSSQLRATKMTIPTISRMKMATIQGCNLLSR